MSNTQTLNWGILGAGNVAATMTEAIKLVPNNHLFAIASKNPLKAKTFADEHGIENALTYEEIVTCPNIDIIYVATTHNFHFDNAKLALENGKHVLVEKAFTVNAKEARELVRIAAGKNIFLMEAMWVRFLPSINRLKNLLQSREIGEVKMFNVSFGGFADPHYQLRLKDPALAGGVTLDMGVYPISFICYLLGELPVDIKSMTRFSDLGVDEIANYTFRFPSGCLANICASYNLKMRSEAIIYGSEGYIEFPDFQRGEKFTILKHMGTNDIQDSTEIFESNHANGFIYEVEEVARCIHAGKQESMIMPLSETIEIMDVMDKMREEWDFTYPFED